MAKAATARANRGRRDIGKGLESKAHTLRLATTLGN
jgi:hypothetical protein